MHNSDCCDTTLTNYKRKPNRGCIFTEIKILPPIVCLNVKLCRKFSISYVAIIVSETKEKRMKKESILQMLKFTLFSVSAGIVQIVTFTVFNELFCWRYWPAYLTSLILSIIWNFTFNRRYTFKSAANVPIAMLKLFGFYAVFTPLSTYLGHLAETAGVNDYIILIITMLSNFVLEFLFSKFIMYKNQENTRI